MNKKFFFYLIVLSIMFFSCGKNNEFKNDNSQPVKVGLVFDVGGRGDKSFNDAAYKGLEKAKNEFGIEFEVIDPGDGSDRESALRKLAAKPDIGLIFGVGFIFTDDITKIANDFPNKKFACIDYSINPDIPIPANLIALEFKEDEGSFLVGAIAAMFSKTGKIGFVGGMESSLIKKFEKGYVEGARYINKDINILSGYIAVTGEGFKNPSKGKEIALTQYQNGADVIYHASGLSGIGVFEAAKDKKKFAIGVDLDQYNEAPGYILTSMVKKVDEVVYITVKEFKENNFKSGIKTFGLSDKGVDYIYDNNNKNLITEEIYKKAEEIRQKLIKGEIIIPSN